MFVATLPYSIMVSIHTPTKGVTIGRECHERVLTVSIHTPTKGVTPCRRHKARPIPCFNPHTHEGCDSQYPLFVVLISSFNPHTHEGCDSTPARERCSSRVSIHTPTKGVTGRTMVQSVGLLVSIHTPTKGVTL